MDHVTMPKPQRACAWWRQTCSRLTRPDASLQIPATWRLRGHAATRASMAVRRTRLSLQGHLHGQHLAVSALAAFSKLSAPASTSAPQRGSRLLQAAQFVQSLQSSKTKSPNVRSDDLGRHFRRIHGGWPVAAQPPISAPTFSHHSLRSSTVLFMELMETKASTIDPVLHLQLEGSLFSPKWHPPHPCLGSLHPCAVSRSSLPPAVVLVQRLNLFAFGLRQSSSAQVSVFRASRNSWRMASHKTAQHHNQRSIPCAAPQSVHRRIDAGAGARPAPPWNHEKVRDWQASSCGALRCMAVMS